MEFFTTQIIPYINTALLIVGGFFFNRIIKDKNSLIQTLTEQFQSAKQMLELFDVTKFREFQKLSNDALNMKHQKHLEELDVATKSGIEKGAENLAKDFNELLDFQLHALSDMNEAKRNQWLNLLPRNKELIENLLKSIKSGQLKSDN